MGNGRIWTGLERGRESTRKRQGGPQEAKYKKCSKHRVQKGLGLGVRLLWAANINTNAYESQK